MPTITPIDTSGTINFRYPMSYPINMGNAKKFIAASAPDARGAVRKFIKATTHISFETFISYINSNLAEVVKFATPNRPLFAYIDITNDEYINKSNYWIYLYVKQLAKKKYAKDVEFVKSINDKTIQDDDVILLIDDCSYSGSQIAETISVMKNTYKKQVHIVLFVPFLSNKAVNIIKSTKAKNMSIANCSFSLPKYVYIIKPLSDYMTAHELVPILKYYLSYYMRFEEEKQLRILTESAIEDIQKYPIYFDHKLADFVSSFPLFYSGYVPNDTNVNVMNSIRNLRNQKGSSKQREMDEIKKQYIMYPLISNCEYIKEPQDDISTCPPPPYKDSYAGFIKIIREGLRGRGYSSNNSLRTNILTSQTLSSRLSRKSI
jgi:hypothetical protein